MYEAQSATKGEFLDWEEKCEAVATQKGFSRASSQYHYFMPASGEQARISSHNSFFCRLNVKRIIAQLK